MHVLVVDVAVVVVVVVVGAGVVEEMWKAVWHSQALEMREWPQVGKAGGASTVL